MGRPSRDSMADRPSSKFLQDLECWDKNTRKVYWDNGLDMKNAVDKTNEVNGRSREFYQIAWIEDEEEEDDAEDEGEEVIDDGEKIEAFKNENIRNSYVRKRWKIQHFSEFKNDKVKRDQCRKFIKSRELIVPTEKLVMKPFLKENRKKKPWKEWMIITTIRITRLKIPNLLSVKLTTSTILTLIFRN